MQNKRVLLASRPTGWVSETNFRIEDAPLPQPAQGEVVVRNLWLSLDPYMRGRMSDAKSYVKGVELGLGFEAQIVVAAVVSAAGCYGVHAYRAKNRAQQMPPIDAGMPASFEQWINPAERLARVRYRGASWDARVDGAEPLEPGSLLYVVNTHGNTLQVASKRPA